MSPNIAEIQHLGNVDEGSWQPGALVREKVLRYGWSLYSRNCLILLLPWQIHHVSQSMALDLWSVHSALHGIEYRECHCAEGPQWLVLVCWGLSAPCLFWLSIPLARDK